MDAVRYFTDETHRLASMAIICGTREQKWQAYGGIRTPDGNPVAENTVYDLASLTKLFTGLLVMRLHEEGILDLQAKAAAYVPYMRGIAGLTVDQILGFETGLVTAERIDTQPDAKKAFETLIGIQPKPVGTGRAYSDMHAMVLRLIMEEAAQQSYMELAESRMLGPLHMTETTCRPMHPERCANYDREHRIEKGSYILREGWEPGRVHDPKARVMFPDGSGCAGHAGLFATIGDMALLAQGVLNEKVVSRASLKAMARNRTGHRLEDGTWTQFLGAQCYVKHPQLYHSEIPLYESNEAIGLSGFTGNHISIDPERGIFTCFLGNRVMNRLTVLVPKPGECFADYGLMEDGSGQARWTDGSSVWSSVDYVHQKDQHFHNEVADVLGLNG